MQYDTTFNMSEYYVYSLYMLHPLLFQKNSNISPPIPAGKFYHELKSTQSHEEFWRSWKLGKLVLQQIKTKEIANICQVFSNICLEF